MHSNLLSLSVSERTFYCCALTLAQFVSSLVRSLLLLAFTNCAAATAIVVRFHNTMIEENKYKETILDSSFV